MITNGRAYVVPESCDWGLENKTLPSIYLKLALQPSAHSQNNLSGGCGVRGMHRNSSQWSHLINWKKVKLDWHLSALRLPPIEFLISSIIARHELTSNLNFEGLNSRHHGTQLQRYLGVSNLDSGCWFMSVICPELEAPANSNDNQWKSVGLNGLQQHHRPSLAPPMRIAVPQS